MKIVDAKKLNILESNVPDDTTLEPWQVTKAYAVGDLVQFKGLVYICNTANTGKNPLEFELLLKPCWVFLYATNRYACIDAYTHTQTILEGEDTTMSITVDFNRCTAFALLNFNAATVQAKIVDTDSKEVFLEQSFEVTKDISCFSAWEYMFTPLEAITDIVVSSLPILNGILELSFSGTNPAIGHIICGREIYLGATLYGANAGITDYSRITYNEFGIASLVQRNFSKYMNLNLFVEPDRLDFVSSVLAKKRAVPSLYIGDNSDTKAGGLQTLTIYGLYKEFSEEIIGPHETNFPLSIQGMI